MIEQLRKSEKAEAKRETEKDTTVEQKSRSWDLLVLHVTCCPCVLQEKSVLFYFCKYKPWRRRWLWPGFVLHILQLLQPEGNLGLSSSDFWVSWTRFLCKTWKKRAIIDQQSLERKKILLVAFQLLHQWTKKRLPLVQNLRPAASTLAPGFECHFWECLPNIILCLNFEYRLNISPISQVPLNEIWQ